MLPAEASIYEDWKYSREKRKSCIQGGVEVRGGVGEKNAIRTKGWSARVSSR